MTVILSGWPSLIRFDKWVKIFDKFTLMKLNRQCHLTKWHCWMKNLYCWPKIYIAVNDSMLLFWKVVTPCWPVRLLFWHVVIPWWPSSLLDWPSIFMVCREYHDLLECEVLCWPAIFLFCQCLSLRCLVSIAAVTDSIHRRCCVIYACYLYYSYLLNHKNYLLFQACY